MQLEGIITDVRMHNSKLGDESWVDIVIRAQGEANIEAAMRLHRAKEKTVELSFKENDERYV